MLKYRTNIENYLDKMYKTLREDLKGSKTPKSMARLFASEYRSLETYKRAVMIEVVTDLSLKLKGSTMDVFEEKANGILLDIKPFNIDLDRVMLSEEKVTEKTIKKTYPLYIPVFTGILAFIILPSMGLKILVTVMSALFALVLSMKTDTRVDTEVTSAVDHTYVDKIARQRQKDVTTTFMTYIDRIEGVYDRTIESA